MSELFSEEWAQAYRDAWSAHSDITATLQKAGFNSIVAFGFPEDEDLTEFCDDGRKRTGSINR